MALSERGELAAKHSNSNFTDDKPVEKAIDAEGQQNVVATDQPKPDQLEPPPNGGLVAWMQVVGSFFLFFNCW